MRTKLLIVFALMSWFAAANMVESKELQVAYLAGTDQVGYFVRLDQRRERRCWPFRFVAHNLVEVRATAEDIRQLCTMTGVKLVSQLLEKSFDDDGKPITEFFHGKDPGPRLLTDEEMSQVKGAPVGATSPTHDLLERAIRMPWHHFP